jgi:hypothetical protein
MEPTGTVAVTAFVERSMTDTELSSLFATYAFVAERAMAEGPEPTGTAAVTVFVPRSMTETVLSPWFATYAFVAERAMAQGWEPTGTVAVTAFVERSMTETVPEPAFATYAFVAERAMPSGAEPTGTVAVTAFVERSMTETVPPAFATYAFVAERAMPRGLEPTVMGFCKQLPPTSALSGALGNKIARCRSRMPRIPAATRRQTQRRATRLRRVRRILIFVWRIIILLYHKTLPRWKGLYVLCHRRNPQREAKFKRPMPRTVFSKTGLYPHGVPFFRWDA